MTESMSLRDRERLRKLAFRQRELSESVSAQKRIRLWRELNDHGAMHPPVAVETWTFDEDFLPSSLLECENEEARRLEYGFLSHIRREEEIRDDQPVPDACYIDWDITIERYGLPVHTTFARDNRGRSIGYHQEAPIRNLCEDLKKLRPVQIRVNKAASLERKAELEALFGDILPVRIAGPALEIHLTSHLIPLMGMEYFYTCLYDCPDEMAELMRYITDNERTILQFYQDNELLCPTDDYRHIATSYLSTAQTAPSGSPALLKDVWAWAEAEETVGLSPGMFKEFLLPYYQELGRSVGKLYYGCCEPMQDTLPAILEALPHIRKVSVSPWSNEKQVGERLRGTGVVYSRKPHAALVGVAETLDEEAFSRHIADTLEAAQGCPCEFIFRDIYSVHGNLGKIRRAVELTREAIDRAGR